MKWATTSPEHHSPRPQGGRRYCGGAGGRPLLAERPAPFLTENPPNPLMPLRRLAFLAEFEAVPPGSDTRFRRMQLTIRYDLRQMLILGERVKPF